MSAYMNHELLFFFRSLLWGVVLLFFYDILRIGRRLFSRRAFFVSLEDLLYWTLAGVFLFGKMYQANEGRLRGYSVIAVVLGMVLYSRTVSSRFVSTAVKILMIPMRFLVSVKKRLLSAVRHCRILVAKTLRAKGRVCKSMLKGRIGKLRRGGSVEEKSGDKA